jgi:response regulator RpfG family c-di-GMP phosphodiesterase
MTKAEVLEHVRLRSGTQFDPDVVEALVRVMYRDPAATVATASSAIAADGRDAPGAADQPG